MTDGDTEDFSKASQQQPQTQSLGGQQLGSSQTTVSGSGAQSVNPSPNTAPKGQNTNPYAQNTGGAPRRNNGPGFKMVQGEPWHVHEGYPKGASFNGNGPKPQYHPAKQKHGSTGETTRLHAMGGVGKDGFGANQADRAKYEKFKAPDSTAGMSTKERLGAGVVSALESASKLNTSGLARGLNSFNGFLGNVLSGNAMGTMNSAINSTISGLSAFQRLNDSLYEEYGKKTEENLAEFYDTVRGQGMKDKIEYTNNGISDELGAFDNDLMRNGINGPEDLEELDRTNPAKASAVYQDLITSSIARATGLRDELEADRNGGYWDDETGEFVEVEKMTPLERRQKMAQLAQNVELMNGLVANGKNIQDNHKQEIKELMLSRQQLDANRRAHKLREEQNAIENYESSSGCYQLLCDKIGGKFGANIKMDEFGLPVSKQLNGTAGVSLGFRMADEFYQKGDTQNAIRAENFASAMELREQMNKALRDKNILPEQRERIAEEYGNRIRQYDWKSTSGVVAGPPIFENGKHVSEEIKAMNQNTLKNIQDRYGGHVSVGSTGGFMITGGASDRFRKDMNDELTRMKSIGDTTSDQYIHTNNQYCAFRRQEDMNEANKYIDKYMKTIGPANGVTTDMAETVREKIFGSCKVSPFVSWKNSHAKRMDKYNTNRDIATEVGNLFTQEIANSRALDNAQQEMVSMGAKVKTGRGGTSVGFSNQTDRKKYLDSVGTKTSSDMQKLLNSGTDLQNLNMKDRFDPNVSIVRANHYRNQIAREYDNERINTMVRTGLPVEVPAEYRVEIAKMLEKDLKKPYDSANAVGGYSTTPYQQMSDARCRERIVGMLMQIQSRKKNKATGTGVGGATVDTDKLYSWAGIKKSFIKSDESKTSSDTPERQEDPFSDNPWKDEEGVDVSEDDARKFLGKTHRTDFTESGYNFDKPKRQKVRRGLYEQIYNMHKQNEQNIPPRFQEQYEYAKTNGLKGYSGHYDEDPRVVDAYTTYRALSKIRSNTPSLNGVVKPPKVKKPETRGGLREHNMDDVATRAFLTKYNYNHETDWDRVARDVDYFNLLGDDGKDLEEKDGHVNWHKYLGDVFGTPFDPQTSKYRFNGKEHTLRENTLSGAIGEELKKYPEKSQNATYRSLMALDGLGRLAHRLSAPIASSDPKNWYSDLSINNKDGLRTKATEEALNDALSERFGNVVPFKNKLDYLKQYGENRELLPRTEENEKTYEQIKSDVEKAEKEIANNLVNKFGFNDESEAREYARKWMEDYARKSKRELSGVTNDNWETKPRYVKEKFIKEKLGAFFPFLTSYTTINEEARRRLNERTDGGDMFDVINEMKSEVRDRLMQIARRTKSDMFGGSEHKFKDEEEEGKTDEDVINYFGSKIMRDIENASMGYTSGLNAKAWDYLSERTPELPVGRDSREYSETHDRDNETFNELNQNLIRSLEYVSRDSVEGLSDEDWDELNTQLTGNRGYSERLAINKPSDIELKHMKEEVRDAINTLTGIMNSEYFVYDHPEDESRRYKVLLKQYQDVAKELERYESRKDMKNPTFYEDKTPNKTTKPPVLTPLPAKKEEVKEETPMDFDSQLGRIDRLGREYVGKNPAQNLMKLDQKSPQELEEIESAINTFLTTEVPERYVEYFPSIMSYCMKIKDAIKKVKESNGGVTQTA